MRAAKALEEKARESLPASSYTTNPMSPRSSERSLVKGNQHKRMQSLQPSGIRDLRSYLDVHRPTEKSPERPHTRSGMSAHDSEKDYFGRELDHSPARATPTPSVRYDFSHTPTTRTNHRSILGENIPPSSATMMALQNMTIPPHILDPPLATVTNHARAEPPPQPLDSISSQLLDITNIVSSLQKDMSQLSRRSKDNATDLISLKEATNSRDEDIRKSLKDLLSNMTQKQQEAAAAAASFEDINRRASLNIGDPHMTPNKQFSFPFMSSPGWAADERVGSPNPYSVEGAASVAMLEKIIREMVTKDGQERLIANLEKLVDKATGDTAKKVSELVEFVKQGNTSSNLAPQGSASFEPSPGSGALTRTVSAEARHLSANPQLFISDEMLNFLRKIKDNAAESGSVTMATKTLVEELRGDVLDMGRELARKIEEAEQANEPSQDSTQEISTIVQEGLHDLKEYMDKAMRERRRQSMSSVTTRNTVDNNEVYDVVKHALVERGLDDESAPGAPLDKDAIVMAVREAYDSVDMKPNVEIQQYGLERDEILQCLREGLQDFNGSGAVTREEIEDIVHDSLEQLRLPAPVNEAHEIREEVLLAVRESLEELKPSLAPPPAAADALTRDSILDAIKEALSSHEFGPQEVEIPQEALYDAIKAGLESAQPNIDANNEAIAQRIQSLADHLNSEFDAHAEANGRDTEKVLDTLREGLDKLGADIQGYVDQAQDPSHRDEIIGSVREDLDKLREDVQGFVAEGPRGDQAWSRGDMVTFMKSEFENLQEGLSSQFLPAARDKDELLAALNAGFDEMKSQVALRSESDESSEEMNEAIKHEFDQLKEVLLGDNVGHKNDVLEKLEAGFDNLQVGLREATSSEAPNELVLSTLKEEFTALRETMSSSMVPAGAADKDEIMNATRELIDSLRSSQDETSQKNITTIQGHLDALKESIGGALVPAGDDKAEALEAIRASLEEIKVNSKSEGVNDELLEAFRSELEEIRLSDGVTREHGRADTEEVLEAVRLGLDDLRSHMEEKLDSPERNASATGEFVDALNDGLDGLRIDVSKLADKPVDMTVSYEILDTLKDGLAALREDIALLRFNSPKMETEPATTTRDISAADEPAAPTGTEMILAEAPTQPQPADEAPAEETTTRDIGEDAAPPQDIEKTGSRNDLEKMELMLAAIHGKVEAMDANIQKPATTAASEPSAAPGAMKEDLASIETMLKEVQAAVIVLQARETSAPALEGIARKEDTDAIETLVANTKAKIEELVFPDPATAVTKENLDDVELVVRTTSDALDALAKRIEEEGATKADVTVVQVIADDIKVALDEMKAAKPDDEANPKATKADVDSVALLVDDLKAKLDEMKIPDPEELPTKADVEQLTGLIHDFRDSHDKMRDTYEEDILKTANNFDDRRKEAESLVETVADVKTALDDMKQEIKTNLIEGGPIEALKESFKTLEETIGSTNVTADVKELMETVSREFERAHGSIEGLQNDHSEKSALHLEKHDEVKDAIIAGFTEKLDDKFDVLMAKYDDAQLLADEQARVMKEKAEEQEKILESTKTIADELRLTIDTLGASITGLNDRFDETTTKWTTDSTSMFEKLDGTVTKLDEQKQEDKSEHTNTREEIKKIESIFTGLQDEVTEYHPKFMMALREIEALVKAHYDHAQKAKEEAEEHSRTVNEEAKARSEELQNHFANLPKLLPAPASEPERYDDAPVQEKLDKLLSIEPPVYSDAAVQEKLDKLMGHADDAAKAVGHLERLDEIHAQVRTTAVEVSEFVAKQTQLITDGNESKEREAEELAILVERRRTQKEQLEADLETLKSEKEQTLQELRNDKAQIMAEWAEEKERTMHDLREEKDSLLAAVASLQAEREHLANQKVRLTGEVSSLHTALDIRREELHMMDAKADALERRILNGIMDHSRALMMSKAGAKSGPKAKRTSMDAAGGDRSVPPSAAANALSLALKARPAIRRNGAPKDSSSRRIASLNQISGNAQPGAQAYPATKISANTGAGLQRSHSVKTNPTHKTSWGARPSTVVANKENAPLKEEDEAETELHAQSVMDDDELSDTGTERRYSIASGSQYAESYAEGETPSQYDDRSSYGGADSEYTYGSGSYMTGSDLDRRTSYGSNARSAIHDESIDGESDAGTEPTATMAASEVTGSELTGVSAVTGDSELPTHSEIDRAVAAVRAELKDGGLVSVAPTDSALGTDLATADIDNSVLVDADYFRRAAEEESTVG
jgi:hypothetical protein